MKAIKITFVTVVSTLAALTALRAWKMRDQLALEKVLRVAGETC